MLYAEDVVGPGQAPTGAYFAIFNRKCRVFRFFIIFFGFFVFFVFFRNSLFRFVSLLYRNREFRCFDWTETNRRTTQTVKREYIWVFFRKFRLVSVCFGFLRSSSVCFGCFDIGSKHRNKQNFFFILVSRNKPKQTRNRSCFGLFRFEPKFIFVCFEDTLRATHTQKLLLILKIFPTNRYSSAILRNKGFL